MCAVFAAAFAAALVVISSTTFAQVNSNYVMRCNAVPSGGFGTVLNCVDSPGASGGYFVPDSSL